MIKIIVIVLSSLQVPQTEMELCKLKRKVANITFLYNSLNSNVDSTELQSIVNFNTNVTKYFEYSNKLIYSAMLQ